MTTSHYTKVLKQIREKPGKYAKYLKHNVPKERSYGKALKRCQNCGNPRGHVGKYGINLCRRCFRDYAVELGFKKYS
jgi:small subunit ribosomal protein S14